MKKFESSTSIFRSCVPSFITNKLLSKETTKKKKLKIPQPSSLFLMVSPPPYSAVFPQKTFQSPYDHPMVSFRST